METPTATPVMVVTGFLGSGKTSLMNALIAAAPGLRLGAIVNELGELDVDGRLLSGDVPTIELPGGCICCRAGEDLGPAFAVLLDRPEPFDLLLLETSGAADPGPVVELIASPGARRQVRLADVVCLVDSSRYEETLDTGELAYRQITAADHLVITKVDLVDRDIGALVQAGLRRLNADAAISSGPRAEVARLLLSNLARATPQRRWRCVPAGHETPFQSITLTADLPLAADRFEAWWGTLPAPVVRAKGFVRLAGRPPEVVQAVGQWRERSAAPPDRAAPLGTRIVLLGRDLPSGAILAGFEACLEDAP